MAPPKDYAVGDLLISNLFAYFVSKKKCDQSDFNLGIITKLL
jgi:hypothetical protein